MLVVLITMKPQLQKMMTYPNKKYVDDAITTGIPNNYNPKRSQRGDSVLNLFDDSIDGGVSNQKLQSTVLK